MDGDGTKRRNSMETYNPWDEDVWRKVISRGRLLRDQGGSMCRQLLVLSPQQLASSYLAAHQTCFFWCTVAFQPVIVPLSTESDSSSGLAAEEDLWVRAILTTSNPFDNQKISSISSNERPFVSGKKKYTIGTKDALRTANIIQNRLPRFVVPGGVIWATMNW